MDWSQAVTIFGVVATNLMTVIVLYMHSDNKMTNTIMMIQNEMKDFHGRLCAIEERNKK